MKTYTLPLRVHVIVACTVMLSIFSFSQTCGTTISSYPYDEDFESSTGSWTQDTGDDINWTRDSGETPTRNTGPFSGNGDTWYMYVESSGNGNGYPNKVANFESPCFDLTSETFAFFTYSYHMRGSSMGTLNIDVSTDNGSTYPTTLRTYSGNQGDTWYTDTIDLSAYAGQTIKIRFNATTGTSFRSDFAIDNVSFTTTPSYCASSGTAAYDTGVSNVTFNTINNSDLNNPKDNGYEDFTAITTSVAQNSIHNLTVSVDTDGGYTVHTIVWIDWNQNYDFSDPGETYDLGSTNLDGAITPATSITVPAGATLGTTRMRVSTSYNDEPSSCETGFDGEVEDYGIIVTSAISSPEINKQGNATNIVDGDTTPTTADDTEFGAISVTGSTDTNTFTIQNTGTANLSIGTITIGGAHAADFTLTASPASSVSASGSTTFDITFDPSAVGLRTASVSIVNGDSDENPYNFNIQGYGITPGVCTSTVSSFPYEESFESGFGLWTQDIDGVTDDFDWSRTNTSTPTTNTGPDAAKDGSYFIFTEATGNLNSTAQLVSPCFDLTGTDNPRLTFSYHLMGRNGGSTNYAGNLFVDLSTDNGLSYPTTIYSQSGYNHLSTNSKFTPVSIDLSSYVGQTITIRIRGEVIGYARSDLAVDMVTITERTSPSVGPGGVTSDIGLWLKADDGHSYTNGQDVTAWEDQGLGDDAKTHLSSQAPTFRDNVAQNINFNPVIEFDNNYSTYIEDLDYSYDYASGEFIYGEYGYHTQDIFIVLIPDDTPITNSFGFMDVFCSDAQLGDAASDATGIGFGYYTGRVNGEIICYAHDSYTSALAGDGYAVAEIGTGSSYDNVGIINTRTNTGSTQHELYYNANNIETTQNDLASYINTTDSRWWLGRSEGWEASLNARVAEVITYSARKVDTDLTQERNRIQSYLGVKYGITLGVNGTSQDYVDSDGTVIWDQSANSGYNYDIAGIGRDDASALNQKQSRSSNNASDITCRTQGVVTIGISDIYDTNSENKNSNSAVFDDKEFLMWGNNGVDLDLSATPISVDMSSGVINLNTQVSFISMQRIWKVVENGGDIPTVKIRIEEQAIRNISPPGSYYMFISGTEVFDTNSDYRLLKSDGNGNLQTDYDFNGTTYITFGYAPEVNVERSVYFDGSTDYADMEDNLDLNPGGFTISAWVKRDATDSGTKSILSKRPTSFSEGYDLCILDSNKIQMRWKNGTDQNLSTVTSIPDDQWHHIAVVYDGTTAYIYIDGVLDNSENKTEPVSSHNPFLIAAAGNGSTIQHFKGNIDEVRVWSAALTNDQLRFIMNQEIQNNAGQVLGNELPSSITKNDINAIPWVNLEGYYPMSTFTYTNTVDASGNGIDGVLRNLDTVDKQTAPLPYASNQNGDWNTSATWVNGNMQSIPGSTSIVDSNITVDWNIVKISHDVTLDNSTLPFNKNNNRELLALYIDSNELTLTGNNSDKSGNGITISHYLSLNGKLDLEGESQLIQTENSDLIVGLNGKLERDQQGTADTFTYNYWSSPVGETNTGLNDYSYSVQDIMQDGDIPVNFLGSGYNGAASSPIQISDYWIWKFADLTNDDYSAWQHIRASGTIHAGEGFTMKGPGTGSIVSEQNYVFNGKPNNGDITLTITSGNEYLVGNPYASALEANEFINDNPNLSGTLYFWEHWGGGSHILQEYQGGYSLYNLSGGVPAPAPDPDVAQVGVGTKTPGPYVPISQGFFVTGTSTGTINFQNDQRAFQKEGNSNSVFLRTYVNPNSTLNTASNDNRMKFRLGFNAGYNMQLHRQILLTIDENATPNVDWGYDGRLNDNQTDDMFWVLNNEKYIIQASNDNELNDAYPIGIKVNEDGINSITIDQLENIEDNINIYVHDIELNSYHNLRDSDYDIFLLAGEYLNRFEITFDFSESLSIDDKNEKSIDILYSNHKQKLILLNPNQIELESIEFYNLLGQSVNKINDISERGYSEYKVNKLSTGAYIVKLNTLSGSILTKKLIINLNFK